MGDKKRIIDLKNEMYGTEYPVKIIGVRQGESMDEKLMTEDEDKSAKFIGNYWII